MIKYSICVISFSFKSIWCHYNLSLIQQYVHVIFFFFRNLKNLKKHSLHLTNPWWWHMIGSESARDNLDKFINFHTKIKALVMKLESILIKFWRKYVYLLFYQTDLNEGLLLNCTDTHTHTNTHIHIHTHTHTHTHMHKHTLAHTCTNTNTHTHTFTHTHTHIYIYTCMCVYVYMDR